MSEDQTGNGRYNHHYDDNAGQPLPQDPDAEARLLSAILSGGEPALWRALQIVEPEDLYTPKHRRILEEIRDVAGAGEPFDAEIIAARVAGRSDACDFGGAPYVASLGADPPPPETLQGFAARVKRAADQRRAAQAFTESGKRILKGEDPTPALLDALSKSRRPWARPVPLSSGPPLPVFPFEVLPAPLDRFCAELARALQVPADLVGVLCLAALATALARCFEVSPWDGWTEPLNLFALLVQAPGGLKSALLSALRAPFDDYEREAHEREAATIAQMKQERELLEMRLNKLKQRAAAPPAKSKKKEGENATSDKGEADLRAEIGRLAAELARFEIPAARTLIMDDVTPERLALAMKEQGGRIALWSAEGSIFEIMSGRYNRGMPNLEVFLQGHAGDALKVDRLNREPIRVSRPALTVVILVQPAVLEGLASRDGFQGRGLIARFIFAVPVSMIGYRDTSAAPVSAESKRAYRELMLDLLKLGNPGKTKVLSLSPDALEVVVHFRDETEPALREDASLGDLQDWASKLSGAAVRIAGLLHVAEATASGGDCTRPISAATMKAALAIARWAIPHARAAYGCMGATPAHEDARRLLRWLEEGPRYAFKAQAAFQATKGRLRTMDRVRGALKVLEDHGYIRPLEAPVEKRGRGRPPSQSYEVNPHLYPPSPKTPESPQIGVCRNSGDTGNNGQGA